MSYIQSMFAELDGVLATALRRLVNHIPTDDVPQLSLHALVELYVPVLLRMKPPHARDENAILYLLLVR